MSFLPVNRKGYVISLITVSVLYFSLNIFWENVLLGYNSTILLYIPFSLVLSVIIFRLLESKSDKKLAFIQFLISLMIIAVVGHLLHICFDYLVRVERQVIRSLKTPVIFTVMGVFAWIIMKSFKKVKQASYDALLIFLSTVFLSVAILFNVNYFNYSRPIPFKDVAEIGWDDFRGFNKPGNSLDGQGEFAFIVMTMDAELLSDTSARIVSNFHPSRSYVFNEYKASKATLIHELYHFRINEYCSRLFKERLHNLNKPISNSEFQVLNKEIQNKEAKLQRQYDDETYHSYILGQQKAWESKIDVWLKSTSTYSVDTVYFGCD